MENSKPTLAKLIQEYNALFRDNPERWDSLERDDYAWKVINLRWKATRSRERRPRAMLDVGCGSGHTIAYFFNRWPLTKYYGLDLSEEAIKFAQSRVPRAQFLVGTLEQIEFRTKFDIITAIGVLEHFKDPVRALQDVRRFLAPEGFAYIEVPNCISYSGPEKGEGFRLIAKSNNPQWEWHLFRRSWEELIKKSSLTVSLSLKGPERSSEFIWVLANEQRIIPIQYRSRIRIFEQWSLLRERGQRFRARLKRLSRRIMGDILADRVKS